MVITMTGAEIPTGAIADLLGKKKTLTIAFAFVALGNIWMGFSTSVLSLGIAVFIMCVGGAFYSGTAEALVYDSLKDEKKEKLYPKAIANIKTYQLLAIAVAGVTGGLLYRVWPGLPFLAVALANLIGFVVTFFLQEPESDTEKFSWAGFKTQTRQGIGQLFRSPVIKKQTIFLLLVGFFTVIVYEFMDDVLAVEFGFSAIGLGFLYTIINLISAGVSQLTPLAERKLGVNWGVWLLGVGIGLTLIISPYLGLLVGGLSIILRASMQSVYDGLTSLAINRTTESRYRATTLSTFNMLRNLPYMLSAYFIGSLVDQLSAVRIAAWLGAGLLFVLMINRMPRRAGEKL